MKIGVFGTGYVGLVTAACLSDVGHYVIAMDKDADKIHQLQQGQIPFFEPGLHELVVHNQNHKRLQFVTDASKVALSSDLVFVAVGTPYSDQGEADISALWDIIHVMEQLIASSSSPQKLSLIIKSTVPIGTCELIQDHFNRSLSPVHVVEVISNPEFLKEGSAVMDFLKPDRVIVGCHSKEAKELMISLYTPFVRSGKPILMMSRTSAELTKYASNSFLAMKISFINLISTFCENVGGADIEDVRKGMMTDSRIGSQFLYAGCGYGGSCFSKDVQALSASGKKLGISEQSLTFLNAIEWVNETQKGLLFEKLKQHLSDNLKDKKIAIWGLSFKPMTDDVRQAPSLVTISLLLQEQAILCAYDPVVKEASLKQMLTANDKFNRLQIVGDPYQAVLDADALLIHTEWHEFRHPDFTRLKILMKTPLVIDGRNLFEPEVMKKNGFKYVCIGR